MNSMRRRAMCAWLLLCLLFITTLRSTAQGNLIPNPSFEEADTCAVQLGFFPNGKPLYWEPVDETPDYYRSCVPVASPNGVPINTFGFQHPQDGGSYVGMAAYLVNDLREMFGVQLEEPLVIGQIYYGSFWANAAYGGPQQTGSACNNVGMLFTMSMQPWQQGMPAFSLRNYAQLYSTAIVSDTAGWTLVSGSFVADSAYQFVVFGNHFTNANTTVQVIGPGNPNKAYVLIDGACLSTDPLGCPLVTSIALVAERSQELHVSVADGQVSIEWDQLPATHLEVIDALGHRLVQERVGGRLQTMVSIPAGSTGCYLAVVEGNGVRAVRKFVVTQ